MNAGLSRRAALAATLAASGLLVSGCEWLGLRWRYRYRLTVSLVRGTETRSGSGVIEIVREKGYRAIGSQINGEAVAVDIPGSTPLFALLDSSRWEINWPYIVPHDAFREQLGSNDMVNDRLLDKLVSLKGSKVLLSSELYPYFAVFDDPRVPSTIKPVDLDDSRKVLKGYFIDKVEMEIVDAPVTMHIYDRLPWLRNQHGAITKPDLDRLSLDPPFSMRITEASFVRGSAK